MRVPRGLAVHSAVFAVLVVGWQLVAAGVADPLFPPPSAIAAEAAELWFTGPADRLFLTDTVYEDILPSLARILGGWLIAVLAGVSLGTALGRARTGMDYVGALFAFFRAVPPPVLIPVFMLLFGIGAPTNLAVIVFGALWPVLLNTADGVRTVGRTRTDTARAFRIRRHLWISMVVLPAALPKIFNGLRISLAIALLLMVISEMAGVTNGIGFQLRHTQDHFDFRRMWAWIVLLGALGYLFDTILALVERKVLNRLPGAGRT
ncbi:MAG: ABC transporter permease [Kibdelosporangium sp.]